MDVHISLLVNTDYRDAFHGQNKKAHKKNGRKNYSTFMTATVWSIKRTSEIDTC